MPWKVVKGHGRSWEVTGGHGRSWEVTGEVTGDAR